MARLSRAVQEDLAALCRSYEASLPGKLRDLERAAEHLAADWDRERLDALYHLTHRLTGSSAIYGFAAINEASGQLEGFLLAAQEEQTPPADERVERLRALVEAISVAHAPRGPRRRRRREP